MLYPTETEAKYRLEMERERQAMKWGVQMHDNGTFSMILSEEVGELNEACLQEFQNGELTEEILRKQIDEAVQVSAVALAWAARLMMKKAGM